MGKIAKQANKGRCLGWFVASIERVWQKKRNIKNHIFNCLPDRHLDGNIRNLMDKIGKAGVAAAKLHKVQIQIAGTGKKGRTAQKL